MRIFLWYGTFSFNTIIFDTQVCQSVRDACANITRWVELDSGYALFLHNDLVELQQKREELFKKVRDLREKHCQLDHRIKAKNIETFTLLKFCLRETKIYAQ